eukprot:1033616-Rhodomonas_salina.2
MAAAATMAAALTRMAGGAAHLAGALGECSALQFIGMSDNKVRAYRRVCVADSPRGTEAVLGRTRSR